MRKVIVVSISIALATITGGCDSTTRMAVGGIRPQVVCALRPTGFLTLAAMLEGSGGLCGRADCLRGSWGSIEIRELAGYRLDNWLWKGPGPPSKTFSVDEESGFRSAALALAIAASPAGKALIRISYFTDQTGEQDGGTYALGARGYYGACVPGGYSPAT